MRKSETLWIVESTERQRGPRHLFSSHRQLRISSMHINISQIKISSNNFDFLLTSVWHGQTTTQYPAHTNG